MPDYIQTVFIGGIASGFVLLGGVLLWASIWSAKAPAKKKDNRRAA
jgi:hypothetical protein